MAKSYIAEAISFGEKGNADLEPELMTVEAARELRAEYARLKKIAEYGETVLTRKLDDAEEAARVAGTSVGKAKAVIATGRSLRDSGEVAAAFAGGDISLDQAAEIVRAEEAAPGSATALLETAATESFQVLRDKARRTVLETEQHRDLGARQRAARSGRSYSDDLGMVNVHLRLEPHVGTPLVNRAEAEAARLYRAAKEDGEQELFERHLADAYGKIFSGNAVRPHSSRPELVVLVSHEVVKRDWTDVNDGEVCKLPGVGPVDPEVAREIAEDAFLNGVFYDGKDLRHFKRWTKHIPVEVQVALELGDPPEFEGVACIDCGHRFGTEFDHIEPRNARGPTSHGNLGPRCWPCHQEKTKRDRLAGKLTPPPPAPLSSKSRSVVRRS
ncbi:MAG: HNH endonuclease [Actinomycetota bacterium]